MSTVTEPKKKRGPGRPKKLRDLYRVRQGRAMHLKVGRGGQEVWATAGRILHLDHPVLKKHAEGQYHKLEELDGLPRGEQVFERIPQMIQREMQEYDRNQVKGGDGDLPAVSRPVRELELKIETLEEENASLRQRLEALEAKQVPESLE